MATIKKYSVPGVDDSVMLPDVSLVNTIDAINGSSSGRVVNVPRGLTERNGAYSRGPGIGTSSSLPRYDEYDVRNSEAYKIAYDLFVNLSDQSWFNRLEAIASRPQTPDYTLGDSLGFTNNASINQANIYNSQVNAINELISQYYEHINTLPVTQQQQFADAGVNYALMTNQSGSTYSTSQQGVSTSSTPSPSTLDFITQAVGTITSVVGSVANAYKAFSDVAINRSRLGLQQVAQNLDKDKFLSTFTEQLAYQGFNLEGIEFNDFDDVRKFYSENISDTVTQTRLRKALLGWIDTESAWAPYEYLFTDPDTGDLILDSNKLFVNAFDVSSREQLDDIMNDFCAYNLQIRMFDSIHRRNMAEFNSIYSDNIDPNDEALAFDVANQREIASGIYDSAVSDLKSSFVKNFADKYKNTGDPASKYALMEILFSMDLDDQAFAEMVGLLGSPTAVKITKESANLLADFASKFIGGKAVKGAVKGAVKTK